MNKRLIALIILVYAVAAAFVAALVAAVRWGTLAAFALPLALTAATAALAIVNVAAPHHLAPRAALAAKLWLAPFFVVNWLIWMMSMMIFHIAIFAMMLIPFVMLYDYLIVLATSSYVIAWLNRLKRRGAITAKRRRTHCLLQCLFVLDVLSAAYLSAKQNTFDEEPPTAPR